MSESLGQTPKDRIVVEFDAPKDGSDQQSPDDSDTLPSSALIAHLYERKQLGLNGEFGSTCVPNTLAVAIARATGDNPLTEVEIAKFLVEKGAQTPTENGGRFFSLFQSADILAREDAQSQIGINNLNVITDRYGSSALPLNDAQKIEDVLSSHGSVVFASYSGVHAAALIGIVKAGEQVNGELVESTHYLMYNGNPTSSVGLPSQNPNQTLSFVSAQEFQAFANPSEAGQDVARGVMLEPATVDGVVLN